MFYSVTFERTEYSAVLLANVLKIDRKEIKIIVLLYEATELSQENSYCWSYHLRRKKPKKKIQGGIYFLRNMSVILKSLHGRER